MVNKNLLAIVRLCVCTLLGVMLHGHIAHANEALEKEQIASILTLGDSDNTEALKRLLALKEQQSAVTPVQIRLETLEVLVSLYYDAGKIKSSEATINELLVLATAEKDVDGIGIANIMGAYKLIEDGKPQEAINKLNVINSSLQANASAELKMRLNSAMGTASYVLGNFDSSLRYFLEALKLTDELPTRKVENRIRRLDSIAKLYISMKDPEKALATVDEALEISPLARAPKILASLSLSQGIAYANLNQDDKAVDAYKRALKIAREAGMATFEVICLIDISDHYLTTNEYKKAEEWAKLSLRRAEVLGDKGSTDVAKINLGFALAGQGRIANGVELVNGVIHDFLQSGRKTDAENVIGELANMYEKAGMYKEALATLRQQQSLSNELFSADRSKAVAALQEQFNAKQREKQIELLGKENALKDADIRNHSLQQVITMLGAMVTIMVGIFIYLLYRRVQRINQQLREANSQLEFHAIRDPLTGLYNRRSFVELMKTRSVQLDADRREDREGNPDCLILLDIDHFKHINDTLGHAAGDAVLIQVAQRLRKVVRDTDMVLRWGGEEFLVYSPKSNPSQIAGLVDRVLQSVGGTSIVTGEHEVQVTMTAGFISLPFSDISELKLDWEKALQIADMALYLGKANGRNRAYGIAKIMVDSESALPFLEEDLAAAVSSGMVDLIEVLGPAKLDLPVSK
ncbi:tetratricopeptide repeat-containing diguanylate cyclase [Undibacterium sp. SXout11W]|uniref:tetratricopeptide repeat-containing diguanylate cyclase n=1 Tax=Undibacterium sp. SXout11W TaxID=3413050 RepID=UPI003BF2D24A